ncbi:MAG: RusA family crossover junction endodeoxyribonuclease [Pseudomonadota bacterium]
MTPEARIIARLVAAASATRLRFHHKAGPQDDLHGAIAEGEAYLAALRPSLAFTAYGKPEPKGSARAFIPKPKGVSWAALERAGRLPRAIVTSDNKSNKAWEAVVAEAATLALVDLAEARRSRPADRILLGPATLAVDFHLQRPQRAKADEPHVSSPDLDKLCRSVGDALTGVLWADDGQVDVLVARKGYAAPGTVPRAEISVGPTAWGLRW